MPVFIVRYVNIAVSNPDKAVVYNGSTIRVPRNAMNWAIFMAGGSFAKIPSD